MDSTPNKPKSYVGRVFAVIVAVIAAILAFRWDDVAKHFGMGKAGKESQNPIEGKQSAEDMKRDADFQAALADARKSMTTDTNKASKDIERALAIKPADATALELQSQIRAKAETDYKAAIAEAKEALKSTDPKTEGSNILRSPDRARAYAAIQKALNIKPADAAAMMLLNEFMPNEKKKDFEVPYHDVDSALNKSALVSIEFVLVPAGTFQQGYDEKEAADLSPEERQKFKPRTVTIDKPFYISKFEITQQQYLDAMRVNPSTPKDNTDMSRPVSNVSYADAQKFCEKVGAGIQLPTAAQWEHACRAGTTTPFNLSGDPKEFERQQQIDNVGGTRPIQTAGKPNNFGVYNMHGNVAEWVRDEAAGATSHTIRGGSWKDKPAACRSWYARGIEDGSPELKEGTIGFRVIFDAISQK